MASIDEVISSLHRLTPEQVDAVARVISEISGTKHLQPSSVLPPAVIEEAVQHGWPAQLFTEVIGSLPDLERAAQPHAENRTDL